VRSLRLLPIVIVAGTALAALKLLGLAFDGGYLLTAIPEAVAQQQTAAPVGEAADSGAAPTDAPETAETAPAVPIPGLGNDDEAEPSFDGGRETGSKRAVLERLANRRETLEARERDLELREQLLKAAETRLEKRVAELKALENKIGATVEEKKAQEAAKLADLVKMYESMKPKSAAAIFDRLDHAVLVPVAKQMKPKKLGDIMARMSPETAEKLTVALASPADPVLAPPARELPKIEGTKPNTNG